MTMSMYVVIGLLFVGIGQISALSEAEIRDMAKVLHDECVEEIGVDEALIDRANAEPEFPDDPKLKCYMKCLITAVPIMTDEGEIDIETALSMLPEEYHELAGPIIRACGTIKGADPNDFCETAFLTNKCWKAKAPEHYMLP